MSATGTPEKIKLDGRLKALIAFAVISSVAVVVAAFVLSFDALQAVAEGAKVASSIAGLMPIAVDGAITVGTMGALVLKYLRRSTKYAWFVVLAGALVSVACNVLHAVAAKEVVVNGVVTHVVHLNGFQAGAIAAIPALALPVSFHLLLKLIEAVMEAIRTANPDVVAKPRTPSVRKVRKAADAVTRTVEPIIDPWAVEARTSGSRTDAQTRTAARTEAPRTDESARTDVPRTVPAPRTAPAAEPARTDYVTEKIDTESEQEDPTPSVEKVDRDAFIVELTSEILTQGDAWKPDYKDLMTRSGYGKSWCEKAVREARQLADGETRTVDGTDGSDERTDSETDDVRTEQ